MTGREPATRLLVWDMDDTHTWAPNELLALIASRPLPNTDGRKILSFDHSADADPGDTCDCEDCR